MTRRPGRPTTSCASPPGPNGGQTALETKIATVPTAPQYSYVDYWGTQVVAFNVDRGHEMLSVLGSALVDTQRPEPAEDASWDEVADASLSMADISPTSCTPSRGPSWKTWPPACGPPAHWRPPVGSWSRPTPPCATCAG